MSDLFASSLREDSQESASSSYRLQANAALHYAEQVWWSWSLPRKRLKIRAIGDCILGYPEEDMDRREDFWMEKIHPDDRKNFDSTLKDCLEGRTPAWRCQHRFKDAAGDWVWVEESGFVRNRDKDNHPVELVGVTRKVHETYQLLDLFVGAESIIEAMAADGPVAFLVRSPQGDILLRSNAFRETFSSGDEDNPETAAGPSAKDSSQWQTDLQACLANGRHTTNRQLHERSGQKKPYQHTLVRVGPADNALAVIEFFQPG